MKVMGPEVETFQPIRKSIAPPRRAQCAIIIDIKETNEMTGKERIMRQIAGEEVDRIPLVGGWNLGLGNVAALAELSIPEYLSDPLGGVIKANLDLGVDAVATLVVPLEPAEIRTGSIEEHNFSEVEPEALLNRAMTIPDDEAGVLAQFDAVATEQEFRQNFQALIERLRNENLEFLPNFWKVIANFSLYSEYGYEAFLAAVALYPEAVEKIYWESGILRREQNKIVLKLMEEWSLLPIIFCGHDMCDQRGPLVSPDWLREHYWPHAKKSVAPLLEAGIRLVHHCDGNVMPLIDDMLECGFTGFQGFQYECGVDPAIIREKALKYHDTPLFLGGLSVTKTLLAGTPEAIRSEVDYCFDFTAGGRGLLLFTSNCTVVETPVENIRLAYSYATTHGIG